MMQWIVKLVMAWLGLTLLGLTGCKPGEMPPEQFAQFQQTFATVSEFASENDLVAIGIVELSGPQRFGLEEAVIVDSGVRFKVIVMANAAGGATEAEPVG